ncbi:hypothetical protein QYE76_019975 [Lolium multiflorum]|uniref:Retrotransposon gag domain-containing protein n=1 Tax=Lolium multiflorum TaxID=4521 RepID=A0AAD8R7Y5_LOLMU|nr:hypothetical protein QYE76_019975 [Lolium multiflorum]
MRAAARAARAAVYEQHMSVHKAAPFDSVPPGFEKVAFKPASQGAPMTFQNTLEEWPVLAKRAAPLKITSSARSVSAPVTPTRHEPASSTTSTKVAVPLTPSKLKVGAPSMALHETSGVGSNKPTSNTPAAAYKASAAEKGKAAMVEGTKPPLPQLRVDAPEFFPTCTEPSTKRSLMWQGVYLTPDDMRTGHVDPTSTISDPLSSSVQMPCPSSEGSFDPVRHRRRRQSAHQACVDFPAPVESTEASRQRKQIAYPIRDRDRNANARIHGRRNIEFHKIMTRNVGQALKEMLPGHSMSADDVGGEIMRRAHALAKWPEYEEFVKEEPRRREYVTQAGRASAKRAALKRREMAVRADSGYSRIEGKSSPSSSQVSKGKVSKKSEDTSRKGATTLTPWPARNRVSSNSFEVFNSLPIGVRVLTDTSETSSASTHFKRKKARKTVVEGPRRKTRSQKSSDNEDLRSSDGGSYNPLSDGTPCPSESEREPHMDQPCGHMGHSEQVLVTNEARSVEEQLATLTAALQQRDDELAALRNKMSDKSSEGHGGASTSNQPGGAALSLEAIQRMIAEGVKTELMQNHHSMRPGYVKPYPPDVDLVPFPSNYRQPQFSKFNGSGSPHEHIAHFLAACQDTAHNGALLLRQFVQTLSGPAFTWYSKLAPSSIKTWEQMQNSFLERFYSTQRTVGITELTQTEQGMNEKAADFINRWRNLSLHCPQPITEPEAVRMCTNNLLSDVAVQLQGVRPITFEELASKATDIENYMQLRARRTKPTFNKPMEKSGQREKPPSKPRSAQAMETTMSPHFQSGRGAPRNQEQRGTPLARRPTLSERQNREYSFPVEEIDDLFAGLKELKLIELPNPKRPEEASKFNEPNFCHYHRILGHTLKDCFVVKNIIQKMIDEGTIDADLLKSMTKGKKRASANVATLQDDSVSCASSNIRATYNDKLLILEYGISPMIIPGHSEAENQHKGEANVPCNHGAWPGFSASRGSEDRGQRRSKRRVLPRVMEEAPPLRFAPKIYQHTTKRMKVPSEEFNVLTIGVFEDEDESLCFPEEEPLEVDQVHLRSGRQLADPYPPPRKEPKSKDAVPNDSTDPACRVPVKYDVIAHLKKIPAMLSVYDALCLSSDMRKALVTALTFPEDYRVEVSQTEVEESEVLNMTFTDEDRLLGSKKHNRPLLMYGEIDVLPTNRIMIDGGSAINLLPLRTLNKIGYSKRDLNKSNVVIHGFNQSGQEAMGTISLVLKLDTLSTYVKFHVIDAATSYNALLGRPWLHDNHVIPSTLHQCIKYTDQTGETVRIFADKKPFTIAESFYADAKFYFEPVDKVKKPKSVSIPEANIAEKMVADSSSRKKTYQYIPSSQRKEGDPIFRVIDKSRDTKANGL